MTVLLGDTERVRGKETVRWCYRRNNERACRLRASHASAEVVL